MQLAAEVEIVESRVLLSGVLTDTTPTLTFGAVEGNTTGNVALATFTDKVPASGFTTLKAAGAVSTTVSGISGSNMAGDFKDSSGVSHGYTFDGTTYTTINIQGASFTHVYGISGNVAFGTYTNSQGQKVGFTFNGSIITSLVAPGAASTLVLGQSGSLIIGTYQDSNGNTHGFSFNGASYAIIDAPGATNTFLTGISGTTISGYSVNGSGAHSFSLTGSTFTSLTPPGAVTSQALGISGNVIVGFYVDSSGNTHGYSFNGSSYTTLDVPGATYTAASGVSGSNIVGSYRDASGVTHGFLYNGSTYTTLDAPAAASTVATGVSGSFVVGSYVDTSAATQSFWYQTPPTPAGFNTNVNWGGTVSGTPSVSVVLVSQTAAGSNWEVIGNAVYAGIGNYTPTVTVTDTTTGSSLVTNHTSFQVSDLADTSAANTIVATAGVTAPNAVLTTFTSVNPSAAASDFNVNVNWGGTVSGTPTPTVVLVSRSATASYWEVVGNPVYSAAGNYGISVTVTSTAGPSFVSNKTGFSVTSAPGAVASFAGAYAAVTGNGSPVLASISQSGDQLTLTGSATVTATLVVTPSKFIAGGTLNYSTQLIANGVVIATSSNNSFTFTTGPLAGQTWTKLDLPLNYTNQSGAPVQIVQNGTSLTFQDKFGDSSPGFWISPTELNVPGFHETVTTGTGRLIWQDGSFWSESLSLTGSNNGTGTTSITATPSQVSVFNFVNGAGKAVYLVQTGTTNVVFIDGTGHMAVGAFISATQLSTPYFPNDVATISNDFTTMTWQDGSVWTKSTTTPALTVTHYTNQNGVPVHLVQNGTNQLAFVDGLGRTTLGTMLSANTAQADLYPGDIATFSGNTVSWQDGFVWTQTASPPLMITFTDSNGAVSHVRLTSLTTLVGLDLGLAGLTATRQNDELIWSNGVVWNNFDPNALNALFEMGIGYP